MIKLDLEILIVILFLIFTNKKNISEYFSNYTQLKRFDSCLKVTLQMKIVIDVYMILVLPIVQLKLDQKANYCRVNNSFNSLFGYIGGYDNLSSFISSGAKDGYQITNWGTTAPCTFAQQPTYSELVNYKNCRKRAVYKKNRSTNRNS